MILERLFDLHIEADQLKNDQPPPEEFEAFQAWYAEGTASLPRRQN